MKPLRGNYLAPIENYTTLPFRLLAQKHGAKATMAPLVSATAIARNPDYLRQLDIREDEKFLGVQLVGSIPADFSTAAKALVREFPFIKWLDINAGCPSGKTVGSGCGAALLDRPGKAMRIVSETAKAGLPVSVKMRLADSAEKTLQFVKAVQGADFLIVHGRTRAQFYSGKADWDAIKGIKENSKIPVVGNGDVISLESGNEKVRAGVCDSFMVGRAALSNPLLFERKEVETKEAKKKLFLEYLELAESHGPCSCSGLKLAAYEIFKGLDGSAALRGSLCTLSSKREIMEKIKGF